MLCMCSAFILDAEVIDNKCEGRWAGTMFPQAWSVFDFVISVGFQALSEELICEDAGLWEAIHASPNLHVEISLKYLRMEIVGIKKSCWDLVSWDSHIFVSFHGGFQIKILDVRTAVLCAWSGEDTVP